jgi:hypothetical protein
VLWLSEDGRRWRQAGAGLPATNISALRTCAGSLYAVAENKGIWRNRWADLGSVPWVRADAAGIGSTPVTALGCDERSGLLYAATNGSGLLLSLNSGQTWNAINTGHTRSIFSAILPHPNQAWRMFSASSEGGVFESLNGGLAWASIASGLPSAGVSHLVASADGGLFAALESGGLWRRSGSTWLSAASGLPNAPITALHADPVRAGVLLAAVGNLGLYKTVNGGSSWQRLALELGTAPVGAISGDASRWLVGTLGAALTWSIDDGASFALLQPSDTVPQVVIDIASDPNDANTLYLGAGTQGVLVSRDGGAHWRRTGASFEVLVLVPHPTRSGELYAGGHDGVFRSRDHGATWEAMSAGLTGRNVTALVFDPVLPDILYGGFEGAGAAFYDTRP